MTALALSLALLAPAASDPTALMDEIHRTYRAAGDISGKFTQTYVGGLRGKTKVEKGRLWAKQDGRVRWQYDQPETKLFIFDGTNAYYYEPHNAQVWVYDNFVDSKLATALKLLMGRDRVAEQFSLAPCSKHCKLAKPHGSGAVVVELKPREPMANLDHVAIIVDPKARRVLSSVLFDSLGYRTEYAFTDLKFQATVPGAKFRFKKPAGVQEIKAAPNQQPTMK